MLSIKGKISNPTIPNKARSIWSMKGNKDASSRRFRHSILTWMQDVRKGPRRASIASLSPSEMYMTVAKRQMQKCNSGSHTHNFSTNWARKSRLLGIWRSFDFLQNLSNRDSICFKVVSTYLNSTCIFAVVSFFGSLINLHHFCTFEKSLVAGVPSDSHDLLY